jgi:HEAT repeat protein
LKDVRAIPILVPLLKDNRIDYKVAWALGEIRDKSAIPSLIEALKNSNSDVRVIAIQSLEHLHAAEALPALHLLLEDNERSHFGAFVTVAEAAKAAIATLEKK